MLGTARHAPVGVLVVDDEPDIRFVVGRLLSRNGWAVVGEAADGDEAIDRARALQPTIIVLDLAMPRRSGEEALPLLREVAPDSMVVVFSAADITERAEALRALGAFSAYDKLLLEQLPELVAADLDRFREAL